MKELEYLTEAKNQLDELKTILEDVIGMDVSKFQRLQIEISRIQVGLCIYLCEKIIDMGRQ